MIENEPDFVLWFSQTKKPHRLCKLMEGDAHNSSLAILDKLHESIILSNNICVLISSHAGHYLLLYVPFYLETLPPASLIPIFPCILSHLRAGGTTSCFITEMLPPFKAPSPRRGTTQERLRYCSAHHACHAWQHQQCSEGEERGGTSMVIRTQRGENLSADTPS